MAGTVMHLVVADRLLDKLNIKNPAMFYCGNLAPDAIMARKNYVRSMKEHTHFKDGMDQVEFQKKENQLVYHKKFKEFCDYFFENKLMDDELLLGYIVHMLVDELYLLNYFGAFYKKLIENNIDPRDEKIGRAYVHDVDLIDWELVRTYKFKYKMPDILRTESDYEIPGWITNEELLNSKEFIINKNFETEHEKETLGVNSYEDNLKFIELCVDEIPGILAERFGVFL